MTNTTRTPHPCLIDIAENRLMIPGLLGSGIFRVYGRAMRKFSKATTGGACPKCGSTSFKAKRSGLGLLAFGIFARKSRVKCQGCGRVFRRG